jgi:hypothetical protein
MAKFRHPCTYLQACHILWWVYVSGQTQTHAAIMVGVNSGTANHVIHRRRFPDAFPIAPS